MPASEDDWEVQHTSTYSPALPVSLRVGAVGAGIGVGCGLGVGFGAPIQLGKYTSATHTDMYAMTSRNLYN